MTYPSTIPENWREFSFSEIAKNEKFSIVDGPFGTQLHADEYTESGVPVVRIENLSFDGRFDDSKLVSVSERKAQQLKRSIVIPGDLIIAKTGATIGKSGMFPETFKNGIVASSCMKVSCDLTVVDPKLILYMITWEEGQKKILDGAGGSTRTSINIKPFSNIRLCLPQSIAEQRKIAEILSTLDEAIAQTETLIRKQERVKQGLMSDLLTRGVDENGEVRLSPEEARSLYKPSKLGLIPKNWICGQLRDFCEVHNRLRKPISGLERENMKGQYPYYGPTGILDYINEYRVDGDFVLIGEDGDHFLKFRTWSMTQWVTGKFNVNNHAHILKGKNGCSTEWLHRFFSHRDITLNLTRQGAGRFKLNKAALLELDILVAPPNEQEIIAEIISTMEAAIESSVFSRDKLYRLKLGLMQDLLTGRVRVGQLVEV